MRLYARTLTPALALGCSNLKSAACAAWLAGIAIFMALGLTQGLPSLPPGGDKIVHAAAFFALALFPASGFLSPSQGFGSRALGVLALLICGAALEWLQGFVPGRESSLADMLANVSGVSAALFVSFASNMRTQSRV